MIKALKSSKQRKERAKGAGRGSRGGAKAVEKSSDGHYVVIDGRRWRATNPEIGEEERRRLVNELMQARRDVGKALRDDDEQAELEARARVHRAKVALGERGPKWWDEQAEEKQ